MQSKAASRLYLPESLCPDLEVELDEERSHYLNRVLRLRAGHTLLLFNGSGDEFTAVITAASRRGVRLRVTGLVTREIESPSNIHLLQGISRGERMDFVVQKATELGVTRISPVTTDFSVVRLDRGKSEKRMSHWTRIAQSACEQCGRTVVPVVDAPGVLRDWLAIPARGDAQRILLQPGADRTLSSLQPESDCLQLLVGPEGGLSDAEIEQALAAGFAGCALGPRILRTETAAIAALAILQDRFGDLGRQGDPA